MAVVPMSDRASGRFVLVGLAVDIHIRAPGLCFVLLV